jgi:hypothetical protein
MPCQPLVIGTRYPFHRLSMAHRPSVLIPPLYGTIPCTCIIYFTVCHYHIARCRGPTLGGETLYTSFALALSPSYVYFSCGLISACQSIVIRRREHIVLRGESQPTPNKHRRRREASRRHEKEKETQENRTEREAQSQHT